MIQYFILPFLIRIIAADPAPEPQFFAVDGIDGILYEMPDYELGPELSMYELTGMGELPIITLLEMANNAAGNPSEDDISYYEKLADVKKDLEEVIERLHVARSKVEKGSNHIFVDIDKSISGLKKLERKLKSPRIPSIGSAIKQSISIMSNGFKPIIKTNGETTFSTIEPIDPLHNPDLSNSREETVTKTPFGEEVYITETKKVGDGSKAGYQKKWTWKSSSVV